MIKIYTATFSVIFGLFGIVLFIRRVALAVSGVRSVGTFVRWHVQHRLHEHKPPFYLPVISFQAADGETYEVIGGGSTRMAKVRESYPVIYPPGSPDKALEYELIRYWSPPFAFWVMAIGMGAVAYQV